MFDLKELDKDFAHQTIEIIRQKETLFNAAETVIVRKIEMADKEAELTAQGIEGKNAEERKAALYLLTAPERGMLEVAEENERRARFNLEVSQVMIDAMRYRLRVAELMSKESEK